MTHTPARTRSAAIALAVLSTPALVALAPAAQAGVIGSAKVSTTYDCSVLGQAFDLPVEFTVTGDADGSTTRISASGGRPTLPLDSALTVTNVTSTLQAKVDGRDVGLSSTVASLTAQPHQPLDLPALTGSASTSGKSFTFTPGAFSMSLTVGVFPATIACTVKGTAPTVTIGSTTPVPPLVGDPVPAPKVGKPSLTVSLTKKTQKRLGKPAKVKVRLAAASAAHSRPAGTVVVRVGKKKVATRKVTRSTSFSVKLPKNLKVGRHSVKVTFTPSKAAHTLGVRASTKKMSVRVKR